jgi:hypothetical protein
MMALFSLFCSGWNIPVMGGQSSFDWGMRGDFGISPPASLKVEHASRTAERDFAYHYVCTMTPGDVDAFKASVIAAAGAKGYVLERDRRDRRFTFGPSPPSWYRPDVAVDVERVAVLIEPRTGEARGYWFFFSKGMGRVWVFYYTT